MSFDARYIPLDDAPLNEQGELLLPDDLADLAVQLTDDAARLAQIYPAHSQPQLPEIASHWRMSKMTILACAASFLFAIGLGGWAIWQGKTSNLVKEATLVAPLTESPHGDWVNASNAKTSAEISAWGSEFAHADNAYSYDANGDPTTWSAMESATGSHFILHEFSGAELEGLYDLMEPPQSAVEF